MNMRFYEMAELDAKYINDLVDREESWKKDHEDAMKVLDLEHLFCFIDSTVDKMFEADNIIHGKGDAKLVDKWNGAFESFLVAAAQGLKVIRMDGKNLKADCYVDAKITDATLSAVESRIGFGLKSIGEWREWKPPEPPQG
jgi:hypothetical protein